MITIAVDAMGGDNAPRPEVEGSVRAAEEYGVRILLVGQPQVIRGALASFGKPSLPIDIIPATEVITMRITRRRPFAARKTAPCTWRRAW